MNKKEYAIYPFEHMNITQNWNQGNHVPHWKNSKNYSDKPWDEACKDSGRDYFIPQNDFIIEEVLGLNSSVTNSVRLKSVNKLYMPYKADPDYLYLTLTHMNEDNLKQVRKGQVLKKGTRILLEGKDGQATGNHFHITANLGKYYGLLKNTNGSWCYTYDRSLLPEEAFYVDTNFTIVKNTNGSKFQNIPIEKYGTPVERDKEKDQLEILVDNLRVRTTPNGEILGYINKGIYNILETRSDSFLWCRVEDNLWIAHSVDWSKLHYKEITIEDQEIHLESPKNEDSINTQEDPKTDHNDKETIKKDSIFTIVIKLIKRIFKIES